MAGIPWAALSLPAALLAIASLASTLPLTGFRRHLRRAEQLSKIVDNEDDSCPKTLKVALAGERDWVSACYTVTPTGRDIAEWVYLFVGSLTVTGALAVIYLNWWSLKWMQPVTGLLAGAVIFYPLRHAVSIASWIRARR